MGTWGATAFENDEALDWLAEATEGPAMKAIRAALVAIVDAPAKASAEADECAAALAAAECIAAARGHAVRSFPDTARPMLAAVRRATVAADVKRAKASLARVTARSELRDLWRSSKEWKAACADLAARLAKRPAPLPRFVRPREIAPRIGDVILIPLEDGSQGIGKIVGVSARRRNVFQFGVYPLRLARGAPAPASLPAPFAELLHGMAKLGAAPAWPVVRNEPVRAEEIRPLVGSGTTQPDRPRKKGPAFGLDLLARGLRVDARADGGATVRFTDDVARQLDLGTPLPGWLANIVAAVLAYAEAAGARRA
jgi:Domain of unknown function (DUF4259)